MSMSGANQDYIATIRVFGHVAALDFPDWILHHASKLGLRRVSTTILADCLKVEATGPDEMLNALALGCSLGPATVLVERVDYSAREIA